MKSVSSPNRKPIGYRFRIRITLLSFAVAFTIAAWYVGNQPSSTPITAIDTELVGYNYLFGFRYPGHDQLLYTEDDRFGTRDLYVPQNAHVQLHLKSDDYIYTLEIPKLEVYELAAPDLTFDVRFVAPKAGVHELLGSQMCGYDHSELLGKLIVQPAAEYRRTMRNLPQSK